MNFLYTLFNFVTDHGLAAALSAAAGVGCCLWWKRVQVLKFQHRILDLEEEMLRNHAHILTLEKEIADLRREGAARTRRATAMTA